MNEKQKQLLKKLPGVGHLLEISQVNDTFSNVPKSVLVSSIRSIIEEKRNQIIESFEKIADDDLSDSIIIKKIKKKVDLSMTPNLIKLINATGIVVHTNLGRSLLAEEALENIKQVANSYSNLEFDISSGKRGSRYSCVEDILCEISGAESAMVVNNNASAVLLALETIAKGKEMIVARGELVEIGGSFRIPDIMAKSGGILKEVGATNRTHLKDYEKAITTETGLFLKVHTSNYSIVGFTSGISLTEMVELGKKYSIPVMEDLGSGTFIDFSKYGLFKEPTVQESVNAGMDIITFSGDKLLGGPQAGIIIGKKKILERIKQNPFTRAVRIDKLTLAALESTMRLYRDERKAVKTIPTLNMLTMTFKEIETKAEKLFQMLQDLNIPETDIQLLDLSSKAGGGSLPLMDIPSKCIGIKMKSISSNKLGNIMRSNSTPIIGRIEDDVLIMDLRTIKENELPIIVDCFKNNFF